MEGVVATLVVLVLVALDVSHIVGEGEPVGGKFLEDGLVEEAVADPLKVVLGELEAVPDALLDLRDEFDLPGVEELELEPLAQRDHGLVVAALADAGVVDLAELVVDSVLAHPDALLVSSRGDVLDEAIDGAVIVNLVHG